MLKENGFINTITEYDYILVKNDDLPGDAKFKKTIYNRFKNNNFNFVPIKQLKNEHITDYYKIFIDKEMFHAVKPTKNYSIAYKQHILNYGSKYIDKGNKVLLLLK